MSIQHTAATALLLGLSCQHTASAQFSPFVNLPREDFTWHWGDWEEAERRRVQDFAAQGGEGGFRCELTGEFSPSNPITVPEQREFEQELQGSLYFIQATAEAMNELDFARRLEWAELKCVKPQGAESDPEETQERVDRAREKAVQEMLERRERRERRESGDSE
jgi:hypothetical protein